MATFAKAHQRGLVPITVGCRHGLTRLKTGDHAGYKQICAGPLRVPTAKTDPHVANTVAMACAVGADAVQDWQPVLPLREQKLAALRPPSKDAGADTARVRHAFLNTLGAVLYRAGRCRDALDRLTEAATITSAEFHDCVFLAMVHHKLGHAEEAQHWFAKAGQLLPRPTDAFSWDGVEKQILYDGARRLLQPLRRKTP